MLILTRKIGESIQVGDHIRIKIIDIGRHYVKIGIDAPKSVKVHREEIYERIKDENISAGQTEEHPLMEAAKTLQSASKGKEPKRIVIKKKEKKSK